MPQKTSTPDIYDDLRTKLMAGHFPQGIKLKPSDLTEFYGCSINTIRETLFRLATVGLVVSEDQRGFRARPASRQRLHDLTRFRITLEQQGTVQSIQNGGIEWEARLTAAHHKLSYIESQIKRSDNIEPILVPWGAAEWEFHETLLSASESPILREVFKSIYDQFRQQQATHGSNFGFFDRNVDEHQRIVDAALSGDAVECKQAIYDHLSRNLITP
ncbi:MAG: GntR family transcriptional regulator [Rhodobacteraceae bacterium]|nr:GntR family transcriptional regulator [Paracoccaceae bacterium]